MKNRFRSSLIYPLFLALAVPALAAAQPEAAAPGDSTVLTPFEKAHRDLASGDYDAVAEYQKGLGKKEAATPDQKMLSAELSLARFDPAHASTLLSGMARKKVKDEALLERLTILVQREERMLQSALPVALVGAPRRGTSSEVLRSITEMAAPAGQISEKSFAPADGKVRWQVIPKAGGGETFGLVYRLGDWSWDEANVEEVTVLGLDSLGKFSYPFLLSDGETLYFSYSGPETLGGRDIFVSRYDAETHTLLVPQQLPIPVNSHADDYAYIYDEATETGAFVTDRDSPEGSATLVKYTKGEAGALPASKDSLSAYFLFRAYEAKPDAPMFEGRAVQPESVKEPLVRIKDRTIYGKKDLRNPASASILDRYLALESSMLSETARLRDLRGEYAKGGASKKSVSSEILALENELKGRRAELRTLLNELIKSEAGTH